MKDILFNTNGDLDLSSGDLRYGEATQQHMRDILLARKGDYRLAPSATVGLFDYLDGEEPDLMYSEIRKRFAQDGLVVVKISANDKLNIDAHYNS